LPYGCIAPGLAGDPVRIGYEVEHRSHAAPRREIRRRDAVVEYYRASREAETHLAGDPRGESGADSGHGREVVTSLPANGLPAEHDARSGQNRNVVVQPVRQPEVLRVVVDEFQLVLRGHVPIQAHRREVAIVRTGSLKGVVVAVVVVDIYPAGHAAAGRGDLRDLIQRREHN